MDYKSCKPFSGRCIRCSGLVYFLALLIFFCFPLHAKAEHIICIDPGHGGENMGAEYLGAELPPELSGVTEKTLTLITALAMRDRLLQYDDVQVIMTRTEDLDLSLEERALIAKENGAEFLFSIHYNASASMRLYGSEVWISAFGREYVEGRKFAEIETKALESLGLVDRGVKTRLSDQTGVDYYGIIKHSREAEIPAVIIEHCHLDQPTDYEFYNSKEKLVRFGELDADCVAEYLGLSSSTLGIDHSGRVLPDIPEPITPVSQDRTDPDFCMVKVLEEDPENASVLVEISAEDSDGILTYYTVSFNGGETESDYIPWPKGKDTIRVKLHVPEGIAPMLTITAYNNYDLDCASEAIPLISVARAHEEAAEQEAVPGAGDKTEDPVLEGQELNPSEEHPDPDAYSRWAPPKKEDEVTEDRFLYFLEVSLVVVLLLFSMLLLTLFVGMLSKSKKKKRRKEQY